jgi:hypothetical protein
MGSGVGSSALRWIPTGVVTTAVVSVGPTGVVAIAAPTTREAADTLAAALLALPEGCGARLYTLLYDAGQRISTARGVGQRWYQRLPPR